MFNDIKSYECLKLDVCDLYFQVNCVCACYMSIKDLIQDRKIWKHLQIHKEIWFKIRHFVFSFYKDTSLAGRYTLLHHYFWHIVHIILSETYDMLVYLVTLSFSRWSSHCFLREVRRYNTYPARGNYSVTCIDRLCQEEALSERRRLTIVVI